MSSDATARDRVWAAIITLGKTTFTVSDVQENLDGDGVNRELAYGSSGATDGVSDETIRRVLRAGTELDVIQHESGSKHYTKKAPVEVYVEY